MFVKTFLGYWGLGSYPGFCTGQDLMIWISVAKTVVGVEAICRMDIFRNFSKSSGKD
jgi:hypothetical protein